MTAQASRYISSIAIEQQARELRAQVVRRAAVNLWHSIQSAVALVRESAAQSRAATRVVVGQ